MESEGIKMKESEVQDAVEYFKSTPTGTHTEVLLLLAEAWLGRKMPAEQYCKLHPTNGSMACNQCADCRIWNDCLNACRLAQIKSEEENAKVSEEEKNEKV
jgi:hypothetical protein